MAPSDSTKVALGVLALAGIGLTLYFLSKQLWKKKKSSENTSTSSQRQPAQQDVSPPVTEKQLSPDKRESRGTEPQETFRSPSAQSDDTVPKSLWDTHSVFQRKNQQSETVPKSTSTNDEGRQGEETMPESETEAGTDSLVSKETAHVSMSMSSWENVKPMSESFTDVKSSDVSQGAGGDMVSSQMDQDSLGSFTPLACDEVSKLESKDEQPGSGDNISPADSKQQAETGSGEFVPSNDQKESLMDDTLSSNGETLSFVKIDDKGEAMSLTEPEALAGMKNQPDIHFEYPSSQQQQYEQSSITECSSLKEDPHADSLPSFEPISETDGASFTILAQPTTASMPKSAEEADQDKTSSQVEEQVQAKVNPEIEVAPAESNGKSSPPSQRRSVVSEADSNESSGSFEMIKRSLGASREQFYSSDSLQSFATATSGGSGMQDFYSPIASPTRIDSSMDNISFKSFDSVSLDADTSEEMTFYDVEGRRSKTPPASPLDRTPTNSPIPHEVNGKDTHSAEDQDGVMSSSVMEASLIADTEDQNQAERKEAIEKPTDSPTNPREQKEETPQFAAKSASWEGSGMLTIDKDKMAEAVLQAQTSPDHLEIGQLQILVELLKQDDWVLLNTACECIIRASAFTINVNILCVCEGPKVLAGVLGRFADLLKSREDPSSQGQGDRAPDTEKIFLNVARAVSNLAMDIKSQKQLESTVPVLTDLLMTEGISETVTLASLQPLTNLSASDSKSYQGHYTRLLQQLYSFLDTSQSPSLRLQCVKLLVNLSLNADMVPHMLAAKAPSCLLDMLDVNYDIDLLLRTVTFLANVMTIMQDRELSPSNLPPDEKAPSPETLYSALSALDRRDALRNKIFRLTRHDSEDVCYQASRLYKYIVASK